MANRTTLTFLIWFCFAFISQAEPSSVLVGDLAFVRPGKWKWEAPAKNSSAETRFLLPNGIDVRFYVEPDAGLHGDKEWKLRFPDGGDTLRVEKDRIGRRDLRYLTIRGTYTTPSGKIKKHPGWMVISATTPFEGKVIRVRILGPQSSVQAGVSDFKKMVEDALKEKALTE